MNQHIVNLIVGLSVAGIIFYLGETNTTLVLIALGGLAYLVLANGIIKV